MFNKNNWKLILILIRLRNDFLIKINIQRGDRFELYKHWSYTTGTRYEGKESLNDAAQEC